MEEQEPIDRLKKAGQLGGAVVSEIAAGLALAPHLGRAVRVHRCGGPALCPCGGPRHRVRDPVPAWEMEQFLGLAAGMPWHSSHVICLWRAL